MSEDNKNGFKLNGWTPYLLMFLIGGGSAGGTSFLTSKLQPEESKLVHQIDVRVAILEAQYTEILKKLDKIDDKLGN